MYESPDNNGIPGNTDGIGHSSGLSPDAGGITVWRSGMARIGGQRTRSEGSGGECSPQPLSSLLHYHSIQSSIPSRSHDQLLDRMSDGRTQAEVLYSSMKPRTISSKVKALEILQSRRLYENRDFLLMKGVSLISFQPGPESYIQ
jgi:hypothetical protein